MKLLYLSTPYMADCDFPLVKALQNKGIDVTYIVMVNQYSAHATLFDLDKLYDKDGIIPAKKYPQLFKYEGYFDLDRMMILNNRSNRSSSFASLRNVLTLRKYIKSNNFDVIQTTGHFEMYGCLLYEFGNKMVRTVHDPFPHKEQITLRKKIYRFICFKFVKKFILVNQKFLKEFQQYYKLSYDRITVSRLGVYDNIRSFAVASEKRVHNILFFGNITPYKGVENIMKAMPKIIDAIPDATLTIAGAGKLYMDKSLYEGKKYIQIINRFLSLEELAQLLSQCEITVCPYNEATQSGVIMTSFSLCKPVVAFNVGALSEQIEDRKTGLLLPPGDLDALSNSIIKLFREDGIVGSMSANIEKEYYNGSKSWAAIADQYIETYNTIKQAKK